ncbi:MAG: hypothetical protein CSA26_03605 [Desulfobacterales bacterium]|nr:MAG: hypothetical protein CSA26_03605 [Desulfobacterales bacterium]
MIISKNQSVLVAIILFMAFSAGTVAAEDLDKKPNYKITGFSFDTDAVTKSEDGLRIESSRFKPLMITDSASDILTGNSYTTDLSTGTSLSAPHGFAVAAEYLATPNLAFHGAIGVTKGNWDANASLETESSWEANIGIVYKFFNSMVYEVHFGYMDTGDVFQETSAYTDVDSIIMISNQLTMSF